jgi:hypothetical protein
VKTKATHKKPARLPDEKVSASPRQSVPLKGRSNVLTDDADVDTLVRDLGEMIESARRRVAVAANVSLTTLYWQVIELGRSSRNPRVSSRYRPNETLRIVQLKPCFVQILTRRWLFKQ